MRAHLAQCSNCQREWELLQRTLSLLDILEEREPPADLWMGVRQRLSERSAPQPRVPLRQRLLPGALWTRPLPRFAIGFAAAAALTLGIWKGLFRPEITVVEAPPPTTVTYVRQHVLMASQEPLADRVALGMLTSMTNH